MLKKLSDYGLILLDEGKYSIAPEKMGKIANIAEYAALKSELMARIYSAEFLKAGVMQPIHHGLLGGNLDLYKAIDPDICLWPSPKERFAGTWIDPRRVAEGKPTVQYCIGEGGCDYNTWLRDDNIKKRKHFHAGMTTTIPM